MDKQCLINDLTVVEEDMGWVEWLAGYSATECYTLHGDDPWG